MVRIILISLICLLFSCSKNQANKKQQLTFSENYLRGRLLYATMCSQCHHFDNAVIAPKLLEIEGKRDKEWIYSFIKYPAAVYNSGDTAALNLINEYKHMMPNYDFLSKEDIDNILYFVSNLNDNKLQSDSLIFNDLQLVRSCEDLNSIQSNQAMAIQMGGFYIYQCRSEIEKNIDKIDFLYISVVKENGEIHNWLKSLQDKYPNKRIEVSAIDPYYTNYSEWDSRSVESPVPRNPSK